MSTPLNDKDINIINQIVIINGYNIKTNNKLENKLTKFPKQIINKPTYKNKIVNDNTKCHLLITEI